MKIYELTVKDDIDINFNRTKSLDDFTPIAETKKKFDISQIFKINGKTYSVWMKKLDDSFAYVKEVDLSKSEDELYGKSQIICPHCKQTVSDSWEYDDYNAHFECGCCGSIFSYERIVNPTYNMKLIKKGKISEVLK